ncbi:MAG: hypothetical protein PHR28_14350, partial [candidate division Zixibacteria bacterium]|nr:hypothetical protein [candidate division Zixibacteria bacterium]
GIASLADHRYEGVPGSITITASEQGPGGMIVANALFAANGLIINELALGQTPANIPQNWFFRLQGTVGNPGNIAPARVIYKAGFVEGDSLQTLMTSPSGCLPQPGDPDGCKYTAKPYPVAWPTPGVHDFIIESQSLYVIDGDSVEVADTITHPVEIVSFTPLTTIASELPDTVVQEDYEASGSITIENANTFAFPVDMVGYLNIENDSASYTVGNWRGPFTWPPQETFSLPLRFDKLMPTGTYQYQVRYSMSVQDIEAGSLGYSSAPETLTKSLVIAPRAVYEVSPQSVTPTRVTVGTQVPFAFDLMLDGVTTTVLDGAKCLLTLTDGSVSSSAPLVEEAPVLNPGPNRVTAQSMTIPSSWLGKSITGKLRLVGTEAGRAAVDTELVFPFPITVEALPGIQVLSLDLNVPNPPYVNLGQQFSLTARIVNQSAMEISGPVNVKITSDGRTIQADSAIGMTLENIPPGDTVVLNVPITADTLSNPAEVFTITIEPSAKFLVLPAIDNQAAIVIQAPVAVALTPGSVSIPNAVAYLDYGEAFEVAVRFEHADLSRVVGGSLALNYSGPGDFGVSFPVEKSLDTAMVWNLTAPDLDINSSFFITWQQIPLDRNSGQPVTGLGGPVELAFAVRASVTKLVIDVRSLVTAPLQRGVTTPIFQMDVQNVTNDTRNKVHLKTVALTFTDRNGRQIDASGMIADSGSAFYAGGAEITTLNFGGGKANFHFSNLIIAPGQKAELELRLTVKKDAALDYFSLQLTGDDFSAEIAEGPRVGQTVPVYGLLDKPFSISLPQAIIAENLGESFKNYPNPFNPEIEQTEIRYYLPTASDVDIIVFTATGEKVREMHFDAGGEGGRTGVNGGVFWDGRNGEGDVVLNGVYVAIIKVAEGDLAAKVKIAVVK